MAHTNDFEQIGVGSTLVMAAGGLVLGILPVLMQVYLLLAG